MSDAQIKTTCEDCIFAVYENLLPESPKTPLSLQQVGCRLGRLEKFKFRGVKIETKTTDDARIACVIVGRICAAATTSAKPLTPEQLAEEEKTARERLKLKCHIYIPALDAEPHEIEKTLDSLAKQNPLPTVAEVLVQGRTRPGPLIMRLKESFDDKINWRLTVVNAEDKSVEDALDSAVHRCKSPFYGVFNAGSVADADFLANIDRLVNEEVRSFGIVEGDQDGNGLVVVTHLHKQLGGNVEVDMVEGNPDEMTEEQVEKAPKVPVAGIVNKVRFLAEKCNVTGLILEKDELCLTK